MDFVEGKTPEEKHFNGVVFPKTLFPPNETKGHTKSELLVKLIREKRAWLDQVVKLHPAVLFRGFGVSSPEEFGRVVEAFGWDDMAYVGFITRKEVVDGRVFTANEAPLHRPIGFHHEMSTVREYPSKIFFYCAKPSPRGGETSILPAYVILEKMEELLPEFVWKLQRLGYIFQTKTAKENDASKVISKTWKWMFKTEDESEAELRAKEKLGCSSVRFNEDGSADFVYGPVNPIMQFGERRVWFHHLVDRNEGDTDNYFGDGTPIPKTALECYRKIVNDNRVDIKWENGDILLVDNLCVQHARCAGEAPREILVSICK